MVVNNAIGQLKYCSKVTYTGKQMKTKKTSLVHNSATYMCKYKLIFEYQ